MNPGLGRFKVVVPHLAAVPSRMKIAAGAVLCVIETETGRPRSERDAAHSVRRDKGRPFFRRAIDSLMQVVTFIPII